MVTIHGKVSQSKKFLKWKFPNGIFLPPFFRQRISFEKTILKEWERCYVAFLIPPAILSGHPPGLNYSPLRKVFRRGQKHYSTQNHTWCWGWYVYMCLWRRSHMLAYVELQNGHLNRNPSMSIADDARGVWWESLGARVLNDRCTSTRRTFDGSGLR